MSNTLDEIIKNHKQLELLPNNPNLTRYDAWYKGYSEEFHKYTINVNGKRKTCRRQQLYLGKKVCEEWSSLLQFDKTAITMESELEDKFLSKFFENKRFYYRMSDFMEKVLAYGYGAILTVKDSRNKLFMHYLTPFEFQPVQFDASGELTGLAVPFKTYLYLEYYDSEVDKYIIKIYPRLREKNRWTDSFATVPTSRTEHDHKKFVIFQNSIGKYDFEQHFAPSILHGAIDHLESIDNVYSSLRNEYQLGTKRILMPSEYFREEVEASNDGKLSTIQYLDPNDTILQVLPHMNLEDGKPQEINMTLRVTDHLNGLKFYLNLLSHSVSLGSNYFSFSNDEVDVTTATQIISNKSETYRNLVKFETTLEVGIKELVGIIFDLAFGRIAHPSVMFDDSIIKDDAKEREIGLQEVYANIVSRKFYLTNVLNLSEREAELELSQLEHEKSILEQEQVNKINSGEDTSLDVKQSNPSAKVVGTGVNTNK